MIIATVVAFGQAVGGFSSPVPQTPGATTTLRRIQVRAQTITALPRGKKYVVDLTQPGVKYEFDPKAGQIDFSRVLVRTAKGQVPIRSFLEKAFPKQLLAGFKLASQSFVLSTRPAGTLQTHSTGTSNLIECRAGEGCRCEGTADCVKMIFGAGCCLGEIFCFEVAGQLHCYCLSFLCPG